MSSLCSSHSALQQFKASIGVGIDLSLKSSFPWYKTMSISDAVDQELPPGFYGIITPFFDQWHQFRHTCIMHIAQWSDKFEPLSASQYFTSPLCWTLLKNEDEMIWSRSASIDFAFEHDIRSPDDWDHACGRCQWGMHSNIVYEIWRESCHSKQALCPPPIIILLLVVGNISLIISARTRLLARIVETGVQLDFENNINHASWWLLAEVWAQRQTVTLDVDSVGKPKKWFECVLCMTHRIDHHIREQLLCHSWKIEIWKVHWCRPWKYTQIHLSLYYSKHYAIPFGRSFWHFCATKFGS
jgi:hypothetical protein